LFFLNITSHFLCSLINEAQPINIDGVSVGKLRRVKISNVIVYNADPSFACTFAGLPGHPIEDINMNNIRIYYIGGGTREQASREVSENEKKLPKTGMFGIPQAYGLYVRNAKDIKLAALNSVF
jgi:hypothetical protein